MSASSYSAPRQRFQSPRSARLDETASDEQTAMALPTRRTLSLQPGSWNPEDRTLDVVWTTGARGTRFDWNNWEYIDEELATDRQSVRLDRLNAGAPVLNTHNSSDLGSQIGIVVPGSARMQGGAGIATLQLSTRDDLAPIVADIGAGIIRNLSVGYVVHAYEVSPGEGDRPLWRAVDWEPTEISFVPIPFDAQAQVRVGGASLSGHPCIIRTLNQLEQIGMENERVALSTDRPASGAATIAQLRSYMNVVASTSALPADVISQLTLDMAERGLSMDEARRTVLEVTTENQRKATHSMGIGRIVANAVERSGMAEQTFDNPNFHGRAIEDALYARMSGKAPAEAARSFMNMSMVQMAGQLLERQGVRDVGMMGPNDVLNAAAWNGRGERSFGGGYSRSIGPAMTTGDFPDLLTAAGQRFLMDMFAAAASPLKTVARKRSARDFRAISGLQLSGVGPLLEVPESGEIKHGSFTSRKETYQLKTFAKQFALSRQAVINDDLGAFSDPIRIMSRASAETEASLLAELIASNPVMSDGKRLFAPEHGNLAPAGSAPSVAALSAGRLAMRSQLDADGVTPLATTPRYVLSGASLETEIEQILIVPMTPAQVDTTNPFSGKWGPLCDPRLTGVDWYLFADPAIAPVLEYAYLNDQEGPIVEMKDGWDTLGTSFRVYMDFGAGVVDWRGAYKNPGAA